MNTMYHRYFLHIFLIIITLGFGVSFFVFQEPSFANETTKQEIEDLNKKIAESKKKIQEIEKNIDEYKKKIDDTKSQTVSLKNQLSILDNQRAQTELDIELTQTKIETLELEIQELSIGILEKETIVARQELILGELIRTLHYEQGKKYIEVVAAYENFSDFYTRIQYIKSIEFDLSKSTKAIKIARNELEEKKLQAESRKKTYDQLKERLDNQRKDIADQTNHKENLLIATKSSEATYNTLLNNLKSQYKQIENEITSTEQQVRKKLEAQNRFSGAIDNDALLSWPTQSRYITAYFYDKTYPYRSVFEHNAIDIRGAQGTAVRAAKAGYVARARTCTIASCYAYVMIAHDSGVSTVYGHLSKILVSEDQFVTRGDIIGYSGGTPGTVGAGPFTTGPHLHFEVRKNGIPVNPLDYLIKDWE